VKIAIVCPYAWDRPGGVQSHIRSLAPALRRLGHEVRVFAPASPSARRATQAAGEATIVGSAMGVPANGSVAPICFGPAAAFRIRRELAGFAPDVLHLHEPLIPSLSLLALAGSTVPAVGTFHAAAPTSPIYRVLRPVLLPLARRLARKTAVSPAAARLVSAYFPGEVLPSPNGIDVAFFARAEPLELAPGKHVLFMGRLEPRKGAAIAIQAMAQIKEQAAQLLVAGDGPLRAELEDLASDRGTDAIFLGAVGEEQKARLLRSCEVYCAPNLGGESFGIVLLEAMAAGCPVVCSSLAAFRAVAGDAARYAPPGDAAAVAESLRAVLADRDAADAMAEQGRQRAEGFDWSRLVPQLEAVLEEASQITRT
jgi:phosphatidyl-myo-inositol alpha-mannosyltransferase